MKPRKALNKFGRNVKEVLIISKAAVKTDLKGSGKIIKKTVIRSARVKGIKYKRRKPKQIKRQLGYNLRIKL